MGILSVGDAVTGCDGGGLGVGRESRGCHRNRAFRVHVRHRGSGGVGAEGKVIQSPEDINLDALDLRGSGGC